MVTAGVVYLAVISPLLARAVSQLLNNDTPKVAEIRAAGDTTPSESDLQGLQICSPLQGLAAHPPPPLQGSGQPDHLCALPVKPRPLLLSPCTQSTGFKINLRGK